MKLQNKSVMLGGMFLSGAPRTAPTGSALASETAPGGTA